MGTDLLGEAGPALDRLAEVSQRLQNRARAAGTLSVSALPTFAMRWLIPRLPEFQRDNPSLELRIVTASTPAEQFRMAVDGVISGPSRQPGWVGKRFLGEARLPVLSPDDLMRENQLHDEALPRGTEGLRRCRRQCGGERRKRVATACCAGTANSAARAVFSNRASS